MEPPKFPEDEAFRLAALTAYNVLDTPPEERFDRVTRMAARLFNVPIALVSLIDDNRQWFKSCVGLDAKETPRNISFCGHAILDDRVFVVRDTFEDPRFADNPLVTGAPHIRFYAGCPLRAVTGERLGTLCVIDSKPREFTADDVGALQDLAAIVERELATVQLATLDDLTNIVNRRGFLFLARQHIEQGIRNDLSMSLAYFDLDDFKSINDQFGHAEGDRALAIFSQAMTESFRRSDLCARIGGDEFVVLFNNAEVALVDQLMTRFTDVLAQSVEKQALKYPLSFSYGLIPCVAQRHFNVDKWLGEADEQLFKNKSSKKS